MISKKITIACASCILAVSAWSVRRVATSPETPFPVVNVADWPSYNRTLAGDRYSPLSEINRSNVVKLRTICSYVLPEATSLQTGPLVIDGAMFFTTDTISYAIDAATCVEKWTRVRHSPTPSALAVNRGFAYMGGRLFRGTSDAHVMALDAADGRTMWDYQIDMKGPGVSIPMAPIAANGLVFIGNAGGDLVGVTGHVYALDARDGHVVWRFDVVPRTPSVTATWPNAPGVPISGGAFWTSFTMDTAKGVLYVPAGNPAPDFDTEMRPGDNLYTNSIIAIEAATGRMLGFQQLVKRDSHDWDVDSPPALVTTRAGKSIIASSNKDGLLSVLDRTGVTRDIVRTSQVDIMGVLPLMYQVEITTRENVDTPLSRERKVHFCPGVQGGTEWNGAAYDPRLNTLFAGAVDWCVSAMLQPVNAPIPAPGQSWFGATEEVSKMFDAPDKAKGWVTAVDADNGTIRWKFPAPKPILAAVTPTAGGILFTGDLGGELYALDSVNGHVLWEVSTGQSIGGGIVTYIAGGRQLLGVASGMKSPIWPGGAQQSRILVYGLR